MKHRFRDPIHGFIGVTDDELKIIDTPLFQRLRRIHQLALTKYVYPTAEHSRFTHSLGVLQSATKIFDGIYQNEKSDLGLFSKKTNSDDKEKDITLKLKTLRFAALLHDIGHLPFSHAAEKFILEDKTNHEGIGVYIILNYRPIRDAIQSSGVEPNHVAGLISGAVTNEYYILKNIISGQLDADRADYLLRDSYVCGVKYGEYDYQRYIQSFFMKQGSEVGLQLCIDEKNIYLVESFLMARYHYNLQVPYHRTRTGYDLVLQKYIETLKENFNFPNFINFESEDKPFEIDFEVFEMFDDYDIFNYIKKDYAQGNIWAKMLMRQGHLIPVFDHIKTTDGEMNFQFNTIKTKMNKELGLIEKEDYFSYTDNLEVSKLVTNSGEINTEKASVFVVNQNGDLENIVKYSQVIQQLSKPVQIYRIYVKVEYKEITEKIIQDVYRDSRG